VLATVLGAIAAPPSANAGQKKPRFRGVSVACLCVEESLYYCYPVRARYSMSVTAFRIRAFLFESL
jgi:hypothetical protein